MSDLDVIRQIGKEIKRLRIEKNITQQMLSLNAGIDRSFLSQIENGRATSLLTIIQILRALQRLDLLSPFYQEPALSPMILAKLENHKRLRAKTKKNITNKDISTW
jgi:transcriptional regulator with XRE-family HTH domain